MYAVIDLKGHQWIVKKGDVIEVDNIEKEVGETFSADKILLTFDENQENINVGTPYVKGEVKLKVDSNFKGEKIYIRKFKNKIRASRNSKGKGFKPKKTRLIVQDLSL